MTDDPCDRARRAMDELCGADPVEDESNTFYVRTVHTQGREVGSRDANEIANAAESVVDELAVTLAIAPDESIQTQAANVSPNRVETYFKLPVDEMTPRQIESVMNSIESRMSAPDVSRGRGFDSIELVDRAVVFDAVPEMVGPPREDVEMF